MSDLRKLVIKKLAWAAALRFALSLVGVVLLLDTVAWGLGRPGIEGRIWLMNEIGAFSLRGSQYDSPDNQKAFAALVLLILLIFLFLILLAVWYRRRTIKLKDAEFIAVEYDGDRTDLVLDKGAYLLRHKEISWLQFNDSGWQFEQSETLILPDRNKVELTYYLHCSPDRKRIWEYVDAGSIKQKADTLKRAIKERLRKWAASRSEGPANMDSALEAYEEARELIRHTARGIDQLGTLIRETKVLGIDPVDVEIISTARGALK